MWQIYFERRINSVVQGDLKNNEVVELVAGDSAAIASISKVARTLGRAIASFVAVTDPEKFVIGGGVAAAGDLLLSPIKEGFLESYGPKSRRPIPEVCLAMLGDSSGVVGAAELARANSLAGE